MDTSKPQILELLLSLLFFFLERQLGRDAEGDPLRKDGALHVFSTGESDKILIIKKCIH